MYFNISSSHNYSICNTIICLLLLISGSKVNICESFEQHEEYVADLNHTKLYSDNDNGTNHIHTKSEKESDASEANIIRRNENSVSKYKGLRGCDESVIQHGVCKNGGVAFERKYNVNSLEWAHELSTLVEQSELNLLSICVNSTSNDTVDVVKCMTPEEIQKPIFAKETIRKCCQPTERILKSNSSKVDGKLYWGLECVDSRDRSLWNPALFQSFDHNYEKHVDLRNFSLTFINYETGFPTSCTPERTKMLDNSKDIWFKILTTGDVFIGLKFWFRPVWLPIWSVPLNQSFCLDEFETDENEVVDSHGIFHRNQILLYCEIDRFDEYLFHRKLFGGLCVSAAGVILVLLIIYLSIWDRQNLAGWTQFNIFIAVFFVFGMEGVRTLADNNALHIEATISCQIIAAIAQYFFFALNTTWCVMNFELFWTFWKLESSMKGTRGKGKRVLAYLAFSWGLPLIILLGFGIKHFEANDSKARMAGIYSEAHRRCSSPLREIGFRTQGVMFLFNVIFFGCTAFFIWKHRRGISHSRRNSRSEKYTWRSHAVFGRVMLFLKLLIVMGVSSLTIPLDYFFGSEDPLNPFEVLFRILHFVPVLAVFFIFGFNDKNRHLLKQKYPKLGNVMGIPLFNLASNRRSPTDTNPSPSGGQNSTEIR